MAPGTRKLEKPAGREERIVSIAAMLCTLLILLFFAQVLLHVPSPQVAARGENQEAMQISFVPREPTPRPPVPEPQPQHNATVRAAPSTPRPAQAAAAPSRPPAASEAPPKLEAQFYARDGRVRMGEMVNPLDPGYKAVPPGSVDERELAKARKIMERPNPIDYHETRFNKDWKSDGSLGQVAGQAITRGTKALAKMINGEERQVAKARPPPDVRFNPALAANQADLGSEATGDAYKAAPIAHEDVPDTKGGASQRIRDELTILQAQSRACGKDQLDKLLGPVKTHLADLERAEHALNHGADPVMAQQMLPRQMDSAYDLARRALWYARKQLGTCLA